MSKKKEKNGKGKTGRELIIYGLVVLSVLVLATGVLYNARSREYDGVRINLAGRQRMLTQKISKNLLLYINDKNSSDRVTRDIKIFDTTLQALTYGGEAPVDMEMTSFRPLPPMETPGIKTLLTRVLKKWKLLKFRIESFLENSDQSKVSEIISDYESLLNDIDHIVFFMQKAAEEKNRTGRIIAYAGASLLVLSVLLLLALKISINKKELKSVQNHIKQLETLLPICAHCKKIRLENNDPKQNKSWVPVEKYFAGRKDVSLTHGMCPDCVEELYPGMAERILEQDDADGDVKE
ncbi:MAG: hypothetical protein GY765_34185 [bacterium]|nr:hypothetical protein [bacterium]